jgi:hypothetical protein
MSGEMRRPPQLWEQRLARTTAILGAGISSSGDATAIVPPTPAPGSGGGTEPAPVPPPAGSFTTPSKPTLFRQVQGLGVLWDGLNADGDLWPYDTSWVEIHADTSGSAFTPSDATLKGRLARPGIYSIGGLTQGSTYFVRLRGADPAGNYTAAGAAESALTGGTITAVYISGGTMAAGYLSGGTVSGGFITGGTVDGGFITGGTVSGGFVTGGTVSGGFITGGTVSGATIVTKASGTRIRLRDSGNDQLEFLDGSTLVASLSLSGSQLEVICSAGFVVTGTLFPAAVTTTGTVSASGVAELGVSGSDIAFRINSSGEVFSHGIDDNDTASAANVRVGASAQLLRSTSTQRVKDHITSLGGDLVGVDPAKISTETASVNPYDVLEIAPAEFQSLAPADGGQRLLGFIAENVAEVFPWAAEWDETGEPSSVADRPVLAALLAVVKDQQATITDLRARIEALEA